jgi:SAM-dependent methyltransferase
MSNADLSEVQQYWNSRPCNIRHSNSPIGSLQYFEEVEKRKYLVEPHIPNFANFSNWKNKRVLEIGCGIGTDAANFAKAGAIYTGVELSTESLNLTKKRFELYGLSGELLEANAENIDHFLGDRKFDLIYSFGVLHHTPSIENAFKAIRNLCDEKTLFKFMVYAKHSWKNSLIEAGLDQPEAQFGCPIANVYSKSEISELLLINGFETVEISQDHIFPYIVEKYVNYEYEIQPWCKTMPSELFNALEKQLGWHLLVSARPK